MTGAASDPPDHATPKGAWRDPRQDDSYRALFETIQHGLVLITPHGQVLYANRAMARLLGRSAGEVLGCQLEEFFHPDEREESISQRADRRAGRPSPLRFPRRFLRADGEVVEAMASSTPLLTDGVVTGFLAEYVDISEPNRRDRELRRALHEEAAVLATAPMPIVLVDERGLVQRANPATTELFGWAEAELVGQDVGMLAAGEDSARHASYLSHYLQTGLASTAEGLVVDRTRPIRAQRKDGSIFPAELTVGEVDRLPGEPRRFVGVVHDLTDRRRTEEQLLAAQKSESLARLISGVAHDFNNLLTVIGGSVELAQGHDARADHWLESAQVAVERAAGIVRQLLQYARHQPRRGTPLDPAALVQETVDLLRQTVDRRIAVSVAVEGPLPQVTADRSQLEQVVMNLLVNAADAVLDHLKAGAIGEGEVRIRLVSDMLDGKPAVRIAVRDNGTGIPADIVPRVFDPFFTTKEEGRGTGLGLSTSYGIVRGHGGSISAETLQDGGAQFTVLLPASAATGALAVIPDAVVPRPGGAPPRILLVGLSADATMVARSALADAGYEVLTAAGCAEAERAVDAAHGVSLVVCCHAQPEADDWSVPTTFRRRYPTTPLLLVSPACSEVEARDRGLSVLGVPFRGEQLVAAVDYARVTPDPVSPAPDQPRPGP